MRKGVDAAIHDEWGPPHIPRHTLTKSDFFNRKRGTTRFTGKVEEQQEPKAKKTDGTLTSLLTTNANTTINTTTFSTNTTRRGSAMAPTLKHKLRQERNERKEREKQEFLRSVVGLWPPDTIETLARHMTHLTVDALTVICREGQFAQCFFFVVRGEVLCTSGLNDVRNQRTPHSARMVESGLILDEGINVVLGPMSAIGEDLVMSTGPATDAYDVTAIAYSPKVELYAVFSPVFNLLQEAFRTTRTAALVEKTAWLTSMGAQDPQTEGEEEEAQTGPEVVFYNRFTTVRGTIAVLRPYRGMLSSSDAERKPSLGLHSSGHLRRSSATPLVTNRSTGGVNSGRMSLATLGLKTLDPHQRPAVSLHFLDYTNPLTEKLKLNHQGKERAKRAYEAFQDMFIGTQTTQRRDVRKLFKDMHGAAMVNVHLADLWARNKRAWQSICKDAMPKEQHLVTTDAPSATRLDKEEAARFDQRMSEPRSTTSRQASLQPVNRLIMSGAPAKTIGKERRVREAMHQQALQLIGACETALSTHETQEAQVQDVEDGEEVVMFNDGSAVLGSSTGHHMPRWDEVGQRLGEALQSHNMPSFLEAAGKRGLPEEVHENGVEMKLAVRKTMALMQFTKRATQSAGASSEERKANGSHKAWDRVARVVQAPAEEVHGLEAAENHYQKMQSFVRGDRSASSSPKPPSPQTTKSGLRGFAAAMVGLSKQQAAAAAATTTQTTGVVEVRPGSAKADTGTDNRPSSAKTVSIDAGADNRPGSATKTVAVVENRPGSAAGRARSPSPEPLGQQHSFKTLSFTIIPAGEGIRPIAANEVSFDDRSEQDSLPVPSIRRPLKPQEGPRPRSPVGFAESGPFLDTSSRDSSPSASPSGSPNTSFKESGKGGTDGSTGEAEEVVAPTPRLVLTRQKDDALPEPALTHHHSNNTSSQGDPTTKEDVTVVTFRPGRREEGPTEGAASPSQAISPTRSGQLPAITISSRTVASPPHGPATTPVPPKEHPFFPNRQYFTAKNTTLPPSKDRAWKREELLKEARRKDPNQPPPHPSTLDRSNPTALAKAYWEDWKAFHLYQVVRHFREMKSFPCVGHSTYALLWKRKYLANPQVVERLKDIKEDDYWHAARSLR